MGLRHDLNWRFALYSAANWLADRLWSVADILGRGSVRADELSDDCRRWGLDQLGAPRPDRIGDWLDQTFGSREE